MKKCLFILILVFFTGCASHHNTINALDFKAHDYVDLPCLNDIRINKESLKLSKEDLDAIICMNLSYHNVFKTVNDRTTPKHDDIVALDLKIALNGNTYFTPKQALYFLGSLEYPEMFEQKILTMSKGRTSTFDVEFPSDYPNPDLAGNTAKFTVCICEILTNIEINDTDRITQHYECSDMEQVYEKITIESNKIFIYDYVMNDLLDTCTIDRFPSQKEAYIDETLAYYTESAISNNQSLNEYLKEVFDSDVDTFKRSIEKFYTEFVILKAIAEKKELEYTTKDLYAQVEEMAKEDGCTVDEILFFYDELSICYEMLSDDVKSILYDLVMAY